MGTKFAFRNPTEPYGFHETKEREREYNIGQGWTITRFYEGPAELEDAFIATIPWATKISTRKDGLLIKVSASYESQTGNPSEDPNTGAADPVFEGWTLTCNILQRPLVEMQKIGYRMLRKNIAKVLSQVRAWQKKVDDTTDPTTIDLTTFVNGLVLTHGVNDGYPGDPGNDNETFDGRILFEELVMGRNEFEVVQPVLRHVLTVTSLSQVKASMTNVGRAYYWSALVQAEPSLPTAIIIGVDTLETVSVGIDWKWQKRGPTVDISSDGKRTITQEYYAWEAFDTWRYGSIITPS